VTTRTEYRADADEWPILIQRENPAVHGGRDSRQHRHLFAPVGRLHTQPRRHDRPHVGTIGQSRDSDPTLAGDPLRERRGYRHKTSRYLRIPHGRGVTGAWHSLHSSVCERKFPTLPPSRGVGSRAVYRAEDVTSPRYRIPPLGTQLERYAINRQTVVFSRNSKTGCIGEVPRRRRKRYRW